MRGFGKRRFRLPVRPATLPQRKSRRASQGPLTWRIQKNIFSTLTSDFREFFVKRKIVRTKSELAPNDSPKTWANAGKFQPLFRRHAFRETLLYNRSIGGFPGFGFGRDLDCFPIMALELRDVRALFEMRRDR